jgi:hypothetical protein
LENILHKHINNHNSNDAASFLFSLKNDYTIKEKNISGNLDFNQMLQNDENYKIVFLFFYAALIYHVAKIMKAKGMEMPRHIGFSGNGSKVVQALSIGTSTLEQFTKIIFERLYNQPYPKDGLTILIVPNPKEITCKGGLLNNTPQDYDSISSTKIVLKSGANGGNPFITTETYEQINDEQVKACVQEVEDFIQFVLNMNKEFSFKRNFGINETSLSIARDSCFRDLKTYIERGLQKKLSSEVQKGDVIEEPLFFYPLNGMLNALSAAIYNRLK